MDAELVRWPYIFMVVGIIKTTPVKGNNILLRRLVRSSGCMSCATRRGFDFVETQLFNWHFLLGVFTLSAVQLTPRPVRRLVLHCKVVGECREERVEWVEKWCGLSYKI